MNNYSDNALAIYKRLYFDEKQNESTPSDVHHRVANFLSFNDTEKEVFIRLLEDNKFRPNSPCLINAGRKSNKAHDKQLCACFVLGLEDSMESIINMWGICAKIYASGAGAGIPITNLREHESPISSGGTASGPLRYLRVVDLLSDTVRSGGRTRRAANIGTFKFNHPETIDIIKSKSNGNNALTSFNLSVSVTKDFMNSVENLEATFPIISPNKNKYIKEMYVKDLWNEIINSAWECGDPGLLFIDRVNQFNPLPSLGKIESTNPCVSGDTLLLTKDGYKQIDSLVNKPVEIWNGHEWTKVTPEITGYNQEMLTIGFSNGEELTCTKYHRFKLQDNSEIEAKDLIEGMKLAKWTMPILPDPTTIHDQFNDAYTQGFFCGDGFYDTYHGWNCIHLYGIKQNLIDHIDYLTKRQEEGRIHIRLSNNYYPKDFVPLKYHTLNYKLDYFAGICDSDGTITNDGSIQISSTNFDYLLKLKRMLNTMGVDGKINISHYPKKKDMPDGHGGLKQYNCKTCYRLSISPNQIKKIAKNLNTHRLDLSKVNPSRDSEHYIKVDLVLNQNEVHKQVYCFNDPIKGMGMFNNITTLQCGEVPLLPWSVCNIGSINLNAFIRNKPGMAVRDFKPFFKWDKFKKTVTECVHFLDNVIDKTTYLHPQFEAMSTLTRPIGLGFMGFADILVKLGIEYGSQESIDLFETICFELNYTAIKASADLVTEAKRESILIPESDKQHFLKLINYYTKGNSDLVNQISKHGIRNSTWTCIAPTGSISMSADASYAWEPIMALVWEKQLVDSNEILTIIHPEFEKQLKYLPKQTGISKEKILKDIIKNKGSIQNLDYFNEKYKKIFRVAHDINPYDKIIMQGAGQKWISLAISSTCNLPHSATKKDIDKIYKHAYKCNLKGITIFRDGCLSKQIVNFGEITKPKPAKSRPIKRKGETVEIATPYGKMFITCNSNAEKPFEIFFRVGKQGALTNVLIDALGRVCSKALQGGIPMDIIVDTLRGLKGEKFWFKIADDIDKSESAESIIDAIALLIDHHWMNKTPIENTNQCVEDICEFDRCPICHRKTLRHDMGCKGGVCTSCDYSSCG